ncbi:hypothetical protein C7974DRAFT_412745 [Boeremia exigua]|uniref:uncharacterized protein n=1 Tax=Boeremia exigua TaxID=749465 RepID=UPI001E8DD381|nr:uncharacterized protein C7974DRAFT_412745 [Boeremia exigua]KAH6633775.1 hypothetical protein C7974DRAFT_412745 [Boeremia exigua]
MPPNADPATAAPAGLPKLASLNAELYARTTEECSDDVTNLCDNFEEMVRTRNHHIEYYQEQQLDDIYNDSIAHMQANFDRSLQLHESNSRRSDNNIATAHAQVARLEVDVDFKQRRGEGARNLTDTLAVNNTLRNENSQYFGDKVWLRSQVVAKLATIDRDVQNTLAVVNASHHIIDRNVHRAVATVNNNIQGLDRNYAEGLERAENADIRQRSQLRKAVGEEFRSMQSVFSVNLQPPPARPAAVLPPASDALAPPALPPMPTPASQPVPRLDQGPQAVADLRTHVSARVNGVTIPFANLWHSKLVPRAKCMECRGDYRCYLSRGDPNFACSRCVSKKLYCFRMLPNQAVGLFPLRPEDMPVGTTADDQEFWRLRDGFKRKSFKQYDSKSLRKKLRVGDASVDDSEA